MELTKNAKQSINNFYPLYYFSTSYNYSAASAQAKTLNFLYFSHIGRYKQHIYSTFYAFYLLTFLEQFTKKKIWARVDSRDLITPDKHAYITKFLKSTIGTYRRFNRLISVRELLEIIIIMFSMRDLQIFLIFLKKCFEASHFKKHKKILSILFHILRKNQFLLEVYKVKGFFFDIRGKVGVSGNAKKRHLAFSLGKITNSSQNIKSYWQQISI